ncbi:formyltetrahydrofolate deformylase [Arthrobacter sp. HLT1-20]
MTNPAKPHSPRRTTAAQPTTEHVLTLDCAESSGIIHAVSGFLLERGCNVLDVKQYGDSNKSHFFLRIRFCSPAQSLDVRDLRRDFTSLGEDWGMTWQIEPEGRRRRVIVMVSGLDHCLNALLYRERTGDLPIEIAGVVSNHRDHEALVSWHGIPFFHVPVSPDTKVEAEAALLRIVDELEVELVILARYMQILSDNLSSRMAGRIINIHHSFLPSFKGAKPYHQAYDRGVKSVGATAHYVNEALDEGPIIAQEVIEVDHTFTPNDLIAVGRDAECAALVKAIRWHCEGRIILHGNRTVILR